MAVRIVTDSTADIPPAVAQELGITVVPLYIHFGHEVFQDGVDIGPDEFYSRLAAGPHFPKTSAPSSGSFIETYEELSKETQEIVSIHISAKLSATYNSAAVGRDGVKTVCRIEVIDSRSASMGLGLLAIAAAKAAREGAVLDQVTGLVGRSIPRVHYFGFVETLDYLYRGGRIGKAQSFFGSMLSIKPLLEIRDGEVYPVERVRGRAKAVDRVRQMAEAFQNIEEIAVSHTTPSKEADMLAQTLATRAPGGQLYRARCGATIGTYVGPGAVTVGILEQEI